MTDADQTNADANSVAAAADAPNLDAGQALKADAVELGDHLKQHAEILVSKIEDAKALTEGSHFLDNAKSAIVSAIQYLEQRFKALEAKVEAEIKGDTASTTGA